MPFLDPILLFCAPAQLASTLKKEGVERVRKKLLPVEELFCAHFFRAYCVAFAEPAMSAKDSFKARRTTGGSRLASKVSKTLGQGVAMGVINKLAAAFSSRQPTAQERRQRQRFPGSGTTSRCGRQQPGRERTSGRLYRDSSAEESAQREAA